MSKKKTLCIQTSGIDNLERAYAPIILATTVAMMNIDATIVGTTTLNDLSLDAHALLCF